MPVYEGILRSISSGQVISTAPSRVVVTQGAFGNWRARGTGYQRQAGYTRREFIQIGDTRLTQVMLMPYYDALLEEAVGKQVALSIDKTGSRNTLIAMRTPDAGLVKPELGKLIVTAIRLVLVTWFVAAIFGTILTLDSRRLPRDDGRRDRRAPHPGVRPSATRSHLENVPRPLRPERGAARRGDGRRHLGVARAPARGPLQALVRADDGTRTHDLLHGKQTL